MAKKSKVGAFPEVHFGTSLLVTMNFVWFILCLQVGALFPRDVDLINANLCLQAGCLSLTFF